MKRILLLLGLLLLSLLSGIASAIYIHQRELLQPLPLETEAFLIVHPGQNFRQITLEWQKQGWIRFPRVVEFHARYFDLAHQIKAGEYRIVSGQSIADVLDMMVQGRVLQHRITLIEGWRIEQVIEAVNSHTYLTPLPESLQDPETLLSGLNDANSIYNNHPEGWFLPDTYLFTRGSPAIDILRTAHQAMHRELDRVWASIAEDHPVQNPYELLILASIIEKETGARDEREIVAGVFVNRLRQGMRLQTDPTLLYDIGPDARRLTRAELRRDHAYNTYTRAGLPPTPIAIPGRAALQAAAQPAATDALFFVSRQDGTHHFSKTYTEHRAAVIRYQLNGDASRYGGGRR